MADERGNRWPAVADLASQHGAGRRQLSSHHKGAATWKQNPPENKMSPKPPVWKFFFLSSKFFRVLAFPLETIKHCISLFPIHTNRSGIVPPSFSSGLYDPTALFFIHDVSSSSITTLLAVPMLVNSQYWK